MGRKQASSWRRRLAGMVLLLAIIGGAVAWWQGRHWSPARAEFPVQGALVGTVDGEVDFRALKAIGADFVYLEASLGARGRDPAFARNLR
ncbi:MAG: lysozyme, partial [Croceibacterium sp.]